MIGGQFGFYITLQVIELQELLNNCYYAEVGKKLQNLGGHITVQVLIRIYNRDIQFMK